MTFRKGLSSSSRYTARERRRNPLPAALAIPGCHTSIRRPALVAVGRGYLSDIRAFAQPMDAGLGGPAA